MCDAPELEPCTLFEERTRRARKPHVCTICRNAILPKEEYKVHFSVFEGEVYSAKVCDACQRDREAFNREHGFEAYVQPAAFEGVVQECTYEGDEEKARWQPILDRIRARRVKEPA